MSTLTLNPALAAARRASKVTQALIVAPTPLKSSPSPMPATSAGAIKRSSMDSLQKKLGLIWPHLFARASPVPLAIGIRYLISPHLNAEEAKLLPCVIARWVARKGYLRAMIQPGAHRVDLAGNLSSITAEHVAHATAALAAK